MSIAEQLQYSTVRIESSTANGGISTGTGYFFTLKENPTNGYRVPVIVTNKHVIDGAIHGKFTFTLMDEENNPLDTEHVVLNTQDILTSSNTFQDLIRRHPDPSVDLCIIFLQPFLDFSLMQGNPIFFIPLDKSLIPSDEQLKELSPLEDIIMVGYPNGIWDTRNNKPIFRKGVAATHPYLDYDGKKEFMIDAACFPGSSGSPVFLLNENGYRDKNGNITIGITRIYLLGTLYAGPQHTVQGELVIATIPTSQAPLPISRIPNNLGLIIKSSRITELEDLI
ncbi:serine protease [Exiguobacterium sp. s166]|uniref:S1 family peptidase n=1 Tax=Exiguobacterium sp. s166 TaxID=2751204 RepID=UPI0020368815|nr:serine protease [Exiguobacterium sp. s166]